MHSRLLALLVVCTAAVYGREWSSSDGKKTFEATFVAVRGEKLVLDSGGGKNAAFPLAAFSAADREFAKNAQYITEAATKLGAQALEFSHRVEDGSGWICRLALPIDPKATTRLYTGETIFLVTADSSAHRQGERMEGRMLYGAGGRTYHPLQGDAAMVRAFALSAEEATRVWSEVMAASGGDTAKQAPNVIEPDVQIITRIGFGVVIGKNGLTAIDPELAKDAKTLVIHHDGKDHAATPFFPKDKAGADLKTPDIMLLTSAVPVEPARIGTKKTPEVGMPIFALSYELNSTKKGLYARPTVTRGIVSRFGSSGSFEHDARLTPENPGGYVIGEKGDVFGFFFQTQTTGRKSTRSSSASEKDPTSVLGSCVGTAAISALLEKIPGQTGLRSGSLTDDMEATGKTLLASSVLVIATTEVAQPRKLASAKSTAPPGTDPPAGWSLSKAGVRHNAKCQYYNAQFPCQPTDGRPCKVCGG